MPNKTGGKTFDFTQQGGANTPRWTASDYTATALNNIPWVYMIEYYQEYGQLVTCMNNWAEKIATGAKDAYKGLYLGTGTGNTYKLPYFVDYHHTTSQNWQENQGGVGGAIAEVGNVVENIAKAFKPSAGIVYPKSWAGTNENSYNITFDLINTVNPADDIVKNFTFLKTIVGQSLHTQEDVLTITPPCLYEVLVPGIRWAPAAVISGLTIVNKGTMTRTANYGIVPDAWGITITIRELINESFNIFDAAVPLGGSPATSIGAISVRVLS